MRVLGISGSLRQASINSALLRASRRLAPHDVDFVVFDGLGDLPLFNPDQEADPPAEVHELYAAVVRSDALLIASPEYAHGVTGTIKNTLDWLVSFEPFVGKLVAVLNASSRAHHADLALREILKTMSAVIVEPASLSVSLLGVASTETAMIEDQRISAVIKNSLCASQRFPSEAIRTPPAIATPVGRRRRVQEQRLISLRAVNPSGGPRQLANLLHR
jgi:NAD(P)H-dependent FMN reductase